MIDVQCYKRFGRFCLDVEFQARGVLGLLGPSGSGKSKTLQCIAGIERPDRGRIAVGNRVFFDGVKGVNLPVQERRVGYLFQHYALFPNMTAAENIACGVRRHVGRGERRAIIAAVMERLGLTGLEHHKPSQLSGGQQQRVALARILVNEPDILLLDEPFSALDAGLKEQVMAELTDVLRQFDKDVVVVTHSYEEAYRLCRTIAVLSDGRIDVIGERDAVFAQPQSKTAASLMGCRNTAPAWKTGRRTVFVPSWNCEFTTACDVRDELCAVGIRERSFSSAVPVNSHAVSIAEETKLPFGTLVAFRYDGQRPDAPPLVWLAAGGEGVRADALGVRPEDILLLYR